MMINLAFLENEISQASNSVFRIKQQRAIGGGSINQSLQVSDGDISYFVKLNKASLASMFAAEAEGLQVLHASQTLQVPRAVCWGAHQQYAYIVMDYIAQGGEGSAFDFGSKLALMHSVTAKQYGWHRDNTIGSTLQINQQSPSWIEFYARHRMQFQFDLACKNGFSRTLAQRSDKLLSSMQSFFSDYDPVPSLLHGDLWSGNYFYDQQGRPVIFDPAVYYGDRETDIAMTELFGGYSSDFYRGYQSVWPLDEGYKIRKTLYNLYHMLNHLNLFGGGYLRQVESMLDLLLREST